MGDQNQQKRSVIILGASPDRSRMSNKAVRAYMEAGFEVYPVHPTESEIEGLPTWPTLDKVPASSEMLLLYVRPEIGLGAMGAAPGRGVRRVFVNPGTGSPELVDRIRALGLEPVEACAILALGRRPAEFPD